MATVTFNGKTLHLEGTLPKVGEKAPDFHLIAPDLRMMSLEDFKGKVVVLAVVPSLDTPVCDLEGRHFNERASQLSPKTQIIMVSRDTPFAQKRWEESTGSSRILTLSDYRDGEFGRQYGVLIEELKLLARAVFVIDETGILTYCQLVPEIAQAPDYEPVLQAVHAALEGK